MANINQIYQDTWNNESNNASSEWNLIVYDVNLYWKSQILALMRNTRKLVEKNIITKNKDEIKAKKEWKNFALKWMKKIYEIDANNKTNRSEDLYNIYMDLKNDWLKIKHQTNKLSIEQKKELLNKSLIKVSKNKILVRKNNKIRIKKIPKLSEKITSFDDKYVKESKINELKKLLEEKNKEFQKILENEYEKYKNINKDNINTKWAEYYIYKCLNNYFKYHINTYNIQEIDSFLSKDKLKLWQFSNNYQNSPLYDIYTNIILNETEILELTDKFKLK